MYSSYNQQVIESDQSNIAVYIYILVLVTSMEPTLLSQARVLHYYHKHGSYTITTSMGPTLLP